MRLSMLSSWPKFQLMVADIVDISEIGQACKTILVSGLNESPIGIIDQARIQKKQKRMLKSLTVRPCPRHGHETSPRELPRQHTSSGSKLRSFCKVFSLCGVVSSLENSIIDPSLIHRFELLQSPL